MLLTNAKIATMSGDDPYGLIDDGCIVLEGEKITWVGPVGDIPAQFSYFETHDCEGALVTPALIDCHTHLIHGGNRANEFEMRLNGATYEEVALAGGGIVSTVSATREASIEELVETALPRLDALIGGNGPASS